MTLVDQIEKRLTPAGIEAELSRELSTDPADKARQLIDQYGTDEGLRRLREMNPGLGDLSPFRGESGGIVLLSLPVIRRRIQTRHSRVASEIHTVSGITPFWGDTAFLFISEKKVKDWFLTLTLAYTP